MQFGDARDDGKPQPRAILVAARAGRRVFEDLAGYGGLNFLFVDSKFA